MIAIAIIASLTVITVASLAVANAIDKRATVRDADPEVVANRTKVAILTRRREDLLKMYGATYHDVEKDRAMQAIKEVDNRLLALADEEAKLL